MRLYDANRHPIELADIIGRGGEAIVYRVKEQPRRLIKVYDPAPRENYARKLAWMVAHAPVNPTQSLRHESLAWPDGVFFDAQGNLKGYGMPFIMHTAPLLDVFNPRRRAARLPGFNLKYLYRAARNLSAALSALHDAGYVAGDLNESNVLVTNTALVTLIDADSFQVTEGEPDKAVIHPCPVGKLEYTPPELQGMRLADVVRLPEHDAFGLGVLIFQLLMNGSHPFRAQWLAQGDAPSIETRISQGLFPYSTTPSLVVLPPKGVPDFNLLHPAVVELVRRCFVDGFHNPALRPSPTLWEKAIAEAERDLIECPAGHVYSVRQGHCPLCVKASAPARPGMGRARPARSPWNVQRPPVARPPAAPPPRPAPQSVANPSAPPSAGFSTPPAGASGANLFNAVGGSAPTGAPGSTQTTSGRPVGSPPVGVSSASPSHPMSAGGATIPLPQSWTRAATTARSAAQTAQWLRNQQQSSPNTPPLWNLATALMQNISGGAPGMMRTATSASPSMPVTMPQGGGGQWIRKQFARAALIGGSYGAVMGALPGLGIGLWAASNGAALPWTTLIALGGAAGGLSRGWKPGLRVGNWVERSIGWQRFWHWAGAGIGLMAGGVVGLLFIWMIFPIILGPVIGFQLGSEGGKALHRLGLRFGWERIWAGLAAACTAGLGWFVGGMAGDIGLAQLGPLLSDWLVAQQISLLLTGVLTGAFSAALGGWLAGVISDFVANLLGLND